MAALRLAAKVARLIVLACVLAVLTVLIEVGRYAQLYQTGPADAAIVLGAAVYEDHPSPVFEERLRHAVALYQTGKVGKILVSGGLGAGDTLTEGEAGRRWVLAQGVPAEAVLVETRSRTTRQNFALSMPILAEAGLKTLLVVSDPLHMRRATMMAKDFGLDVRPSPTPTTRYRSPMAQTEFLLRETWFVFYYLFAGE